MKKGVLLSIIPFLLTLVSAYGEQGGTFIGGFFIDTNMLGGAIIFVLLFWMMSFATSKLHMFGSKTARVMISLILSLFSIYGLAKTGLSFEKLFQNIGLSSLIEIYFPHAIALIAIICMFIWGIGVVLMVAGAIFIVLGIIASTNPEFIYNWEFLIFFGAAIFLIGLAIRKKKDKSEKALKLGRKIGYGMAWTGDKLYRGGRGIAKGLHGAGKWTGKQFNGPSQPIPKQIKYGTLDTSKYDPRETKKRTTKELQKKYDYYSKLIQKIMKNNNGIIPGYDQNSPTPGTGWERHQYIQAMKAIENLADQQKLKLKNERWYEPLLKKAIKKLKNRNQDTGKLIQTSRELLNKTNTLIQNTGSIINQKSIQLKNFMQEKENETIQAINNINQRIKVRKRASKIAIRKKYDSTRESINEMMNNQNERLAEEQEIGSYQQAGYIAGNKIAKTEKEIREKLIKASQTIEEERKKLIEEAKKLSIEAEEKIIDSYKEIKDYFKKKSRTKKFNKLNTIAIEKRIKKYQSQMDELTSEYKKLTWDLKKHEQYVIKGIESSIKKVEDINQRILNIDKELVNLQNKISQNQFD